MRDLIFCTSIIIICQGCSAFKAQTFNSTTQFSMCDLDWSGANQDYLSRCQTSGVVKCQGFNTMGNFGSADLIKLSDDHVHGNIYPRSDGEFRASVDPVVKKSGEGALRFKLDAGYASSDIAGQYLCCGDSGVPPSIAEGLGGYFMENTDWYVQFSVRFSPEYFSNQDNGWNSTPKISIFHYNNQSCGSKELATNLYYNSRWLHGYKDCGGNGLWTELDGFTFRPASSGPPLLIEQGEHSCDYGGYTDCFKLPSDTWVTLYYKIHNGTWGSPDSTMEGWYAVDGQPYKKWLNITSNFTVGCNGDVPCPNEAFNNITLTPYMTALSQAAAFDAYVWYDELIVSTKPIAAPGATQPPDCLSKSRT
jgi:hypothetical protein